MKEFRGIIGGEQNATTQCFKVYMLGMEVEWLE